MSHIHIGYGDSATGCLLEALKNHGLEGDGAVPSRDDFTQGPISECLIPGGLIQRMDYWEEVDRKLGGRFEPREFFQQSKKILDDLEAEEVTIWVGDSCHDILATGWLISYLEDKDFDWYIVNLAEVEEEDSPNNIPVVNLAMYTPEQIGNLYKYRRSLSIQDEEYYRSIWNKAASENGHYRNLSENKILTVDADYYDEYILSFVPEEFESTTKIIGKILRDGEHRISDTTVELNLRKMIDKDVLEFSGDLSSMKSYSIRRNTSDQKVEF